MCERIRQKVNLINSQAMLLVYFPTLTGVAPSPEIIILPYNVQYNATTPTYYLLSELRLPLLRCIVTCRRIQSS